MNENTILTLNLSIPETNAVLAGLQELPAKISNPLSQKIQQQAQAQLKSDELEEKQLPGN